MYIVQAHRHYLLKHLAQAEQRREAAEAGATLFFDFIFQKKQRAELPFNAAE